MSCTGLSKTKHKTLRCGGADNSLIPEFGACFRLTLTESSHSVLILLLPLDHCYTESPVCKMNVAVFSSSSLLP